MLRWMRNVVVKRWIERLKRTPLHPQWLVETRAETARWLAPQLRGTVLDIGCGDRWLETLITADSRYIGLDSVHTGTELYGARPALYADATRLPIADASIDRVALLDVLEHLEHPQAALREIARVLKPGGSLLVSVPFLYPVHDAPFDFQRPTEHGLKRDLHAAGLSIAWIKNNDHALRAAAILAALSVAGVALESVRRRNWRVVLVPLLIGLIPLINLAGWVGVRVFPDWPAATSGYRLKADKPPKRRDL
jgi:SAM-dependent methyltransferase